MMYKAYSILFACVFINITFHYGQTVNWHWAKKIGGISSDLPQGIAIDAAGNAYITGFYGKSVDFDPGIGVASYTVAGAPNSGEDIFISKYDSAGNFVWAKSIGDVNPDQGYAVTLDDSANVIFCGYFSFTPDFDPGPGSDTLVAIGFNNSFICKFDSAGNHIWAVSFKTDAVTSFPSNEITTDVAGNIFITGEFRDTGEFDPGPGVLNMVSAGLTDNYISKFTSQGDFVWARSFGGVQSEQSKAIAVDSSANVYVTGFFTDTVDFDPGAGISFLYSSLGKMFISKFDSSGNFIWAKQFGASITDEWNSIRVDASANIYLAGYFRGTVDFDPGLGTQYLTAPNPSEDGFISKLDSAGNFIWARRIGSTGQDRIYGLALDNQGEPYTTGVFRNTVDFDPGAGVYNLTSMQGNGNIFVWSLDASGNFKWAAAATGNSFDVGSSIAVFDSGAVYFAGYYRSTQLTCGPFVLPANQGAEDILFAKLNGDFITSIQNPVLNEIAIYPIPTTDHLMVDILLCDKVELIITDALGIVRFQSSYSMINSASIDLKNFTKGIYFLSIRLNKEMLTKKIVVE